MYYGTSRQAYKTLFSPTLRKANSPNYYQRKGRTIQQTPLHMSDIPTHVISRKYLDQMYQTLKSYKYPIYSPISSPRIIFNDIVYTLDSGGILLTAPNQFISLAFSRLWNAVFSTFQNILSPSLSNVSNFQFIINILSINLFGSFSYSSTQGSCQFNFYFNDSSSILSIPNTAKVLANDGNQLISLQSLNDSSYLESWSLSFPNLNTIRQGSSEIANKLENLTNLHLYQYLFTDPSILPFLASKDYNSFNPSLYNISYGGTKTGNTNISSSSLCAQVHLQYTLSS